MKNLITTTNLVLKLEEQPLSYMDNKYQIVLKYVHFIKQNLEENYIVNGVLAHPFNRFMPCDLKGNVLKKPFKYEQYLRYNSSSKTIEDFPTEEDFSTGVWDACVEYYNACTRIVFDVNIIENRAHINQADFYLGHNMHYVYYYGPSNGNKCCWQRLPQNIESIIQYNQPLTQLGATMAGLDMIIM